MTSVPDPILVSSSVVDLSKRFRGTATVVASPATNAETIIASLTLSDAIQIVSNIKIFGWCSFTVGTSGVTATLRVRATNVAGTLLQTTGAITVVAGQVYAPSIQAVDGSGVLPGQVYVLTLQIGSGAATSTVSAVNLRADII
jgi:hypothetical protein